LYPDEDKGGVEEGVVAEEEEEEEEEEEDNGPVPKLVSVSIKPLPSSLTPLQLPLSAQHLKADHCSTLTSSLFSQTPSPVGTLSISFTAPAKAPMAFSNSPMASKAGAVSKITVLAPIFLPLPAAIIPTAVPPTAQAISSSPISL